MEPDRPQVVIVDDRDTHSDALRQALERRGMPVVVLLLADGDPAYGLDDALRAGAQGFVRRTAPVRDVVDVVLAAAEGRALRAPVTGPVQAAVAQPATMSSFSATAGEPSAR
jgi:DNA-binding NarL/FixJ family response regulator